MKSIASTIWCRGIWAGAPRRPCGSNRSATNSHCSSVKAIAKLMPAIVAARGVSFDGTNTAVRTRTFGYRPSAGGTPSEVEHSTPSRAAGRRSASALRGVGAIEHLLQAPETFAHELDDRVSLAVRDLSLI